MLMMLGRGAESSYRCQPKPAVPLLHPPAVHLHFRDGSMHGNDAFCCSRWCEQPVLSLSQQPPPGQA